MVRKIFDLPGFANEQKGEYVTKRIIMSPKRDYLHIVPRLLKALKRRDGRNDKRALLIILYCDLLCSDIKCPFKQSELFRISKQNNNITKNLLDKIVSKVSLSN